MKYTVNIDTMDEFPRELTRATLEQDILMLNRHPQEEDLDTFDALQQVLAWYSTKEQLLAFEAKLDVSPYWAKFGKARKEAAAEAELKVGLAMVQQMFPGVKGVGFIV